MCVLYAYHWAQLSFPAQQGTVLIIFPLVLQASDKHHCSLLSIEGEGSIS